MIRAFQAELVKLQRHRVLVAAAATSLVFAVGSAVVVLSSARPASTGPQGRAPSVETLAGAGGGTEVFATTVSFAGTFLFVVFAGALAAEFSRGTIRSMLLRQPSRLRLLAGKTTALLAFAAVVLALTESLTWVSAKLLAPLWDIPTGSWVSLAGLGDAVGDFGMALVWVTGYALLAMPLAVLLRSVSVTLAVGIAWAGPIEHILQDAWGPASRFFPGLLLEAFAAGGTPDVTAERALLTVGVYLIGATAVAGYVFARRDVTA